MAGDPRVGYHIPGLHGAFPPLPSVPHGVWISVCPIPVKIAADGFGAALWSCAIVLVTRPTYYYFPLESPPLFSGSFLPSAEGAARMGVTGPPKLLQASRSSSLAQPFIFPDH